MTTPAEVDEWLLAREDEHLEFKHRANTIDVDELVKYCVALANEGGGRLVLGVSDRKPRRVLGTLALRDHDVAHRILQRIQLRVSIEEVLHPEGRVVVVTIPGRPLGQPVHDGGRYLVRVGENLAPMLPQQLKRILDETSPDYSALPCTGAGRFDLDPAAIRRFKELWARKSGRPELLDDQDVGVLEDAELLVDGVPTNAAMILMAGRSSLSRFMGQAEIIHEFREAQSDEVASKRFEFREPFVLVVDELWRSVNAFNTEERIEEGFFKWTIPMFREQVVREAVLNAVAHRDYRSQAPTFIRQTTKELVVSSPGGFPDSVTAENILTKSVPRNRRLAEALGRCGLVERAGSGADLMFRMTLSDGKATPDYSGSNADEVVLRLRGQIQHPAFVQFLQAAANDRGSRFNVNDLLVLDLIARDQKLAPEHQQRAAELEANGVVESHGTGRSRKWLLSSRFYALTGKPAEYTRRRGLARGEHELLLLKHLAKFGPSSMAQLSQVVTTLDRKSVLKVLKALKEQGKVALEGSKRGSKWRLAGQNSLATVETSSAYAPRESGGAGQNPDKTHK